jgi:hypothetical protein
MMRCLTIADIYDALTTTRPYRDEYPRCPYQHGYQFRYSNPDGHIHQHRF